MKSAAEVSSSVIDNCSIEIGKDGRATLAGALTFESVAGLFGETQKLFRGPQPVTLIDLSNITNADSAGLALLLEWQAMLRAASRKLEINNVPASLISLARLCEADDVMNLNSRNSQQ
jgi:phospholipid transport system transporter-binding protein